MDRTRNEWETVSILKDPPYGRHLWACCVVCEMKYCMYCRKELFARSLEGDCGFYVAQRNTTREINTKIYPVIGQL